MENIEWNTEVEVNLDEVARVVRSESFARYLLDETEDFAVAAYILQALLDRLEADGQQVDFD
jgi:hypothetical protein